MYHADKKVITATIIPLARCALNQVLEALRLYREVSVLSRRVWVCCIGRLANSGQKVVYSGQSVNSALVLDLVVTVASTCH